MSVFCSHCRKRLILENYTIKTFQGLKGYATCGDVVVEKRGRVAAPIQANNLTVKGIVQGNVQARGKVEVASTGSLVGDVSAPSLCVRRGARLDGFCHIQPLAQSSGAASPTEGGLQRIPEPASPGVVKPIRTTRQRKKTADNKN